MQDKKTILIVDDSAMNRSLLSDILSERYETLEGANGEEALRILAQQSDHISLVLLDIVMPLMDGYEVLTAMRQRKLLPAIPVIMISSETATAYIDQAYDLGATDYIARPFDERVVLRRVENTIMLYAKQKHLETMVTEQIMEKEANNMQMVEILSNIVEFRNGESGMHVMRIRIITALLLQRLRTIAPQYGLTAEKIALISNASALHDVGKISIDTAILNKPGKLTEEEYAIMKTHAQIGAQMLERVADNQKLAFLQVARNICRWHHERYDGRGYPDGLKGEQIPICAQIVALADVYDALISPRVYKAAFSHETAVAMILDGQCGAFNPLLLQCLQESSETLKNEIATAGTQSLSSLEVRRVGNELFERGDIHISNRTITLLEQERMKIEFYASMSKDILFEYDTNTDIIEFSQWGVDYLKVPRMITNPAGSTLLSPEARQFFAEFLQRLEKITPTDYLITGRYCFRLHGKPHWFKVFARPLWDNDEEGTFSRVIGKLVDVHDDYIRMTKLEKMAYSDLMTGLYNHESARRLITKRLEDHHDEHYMLLIVDTDHFKRVNDQYGHAFGDKVLVKMARSLEAGTRVDDVVARFGGDEFMLFIAYKKNPEMIAEHIHKLFYVECEGYNATVSMGAACYPQDGEDYDSLFLRADTALYAVKNRGKSNWAFYNEEMSTFPGAHSLLEH